MDNEKVPKKGEKFVCDKCNFITERKSHYDRHKLTPKHFRITMDNDTLIIPDEKLFNCKCGKTYNYMSGLCKHKKQCPHENNTTEIEKQPDNAVENDDSAVSNENIVVLIKQNHEFQRLIIEQNKMMLDMSNKMNTNITNNTMNTMNNKFNLNVFLNETCKDALNLNDFVKSLQITTADFERFGKNGFVEGISNIMVKGLNKLDVCKRPIHCSDLKRETIHLKEDNVWGKETDDGSKLKKVIKQIKHKNIDCTDAWKEENPEYKDCQSKVHERYMKIINESMGGYDIEEDEVFYNKIIKNVAKETVIKKTDTV